MRSSHFPLLDSLSRAAWCITLLAVYVRVATAGLTTYIFTQYPSGVWGDPPPMYHMTNSFRAKDMTFAPTNWYIMKMRCNYDPSLLDGAPTTNLWPGHTNSWMPPGVMGGRGTPPISGWYTHVGHDYSGELPDTGQPGTLFSDLQGVYQQFGTMRLFSANNPTAAAYYGTVTPYIDLDPIDPDDFLCDPVCVIASNVNPAYAIPLTVTYPPDYAVFAQSAYPAEGWMPAGDGNNVLPHTILTVLWFNVSLGINGSGYVAPDGTWTANVTISNQSEIAAFTNEIKFIAMAQSVRPGLPVSAFITRHIIGVPEPSWTLIMLLVVCVTHFRCHVISSSQLSRSSR